MLAPIPEFTSSLQTLNTIILDDQKKQLDFGLRFNEAIQIQATKPIREEEVSGTQGTLIYLDISKFNLEEKIKEVTLLSPKNWMIQIWDQTIGFYLKQGTQDLSANESLHFLLNKVHLPSELKAEPIHISIDVWNEGEMLSEDLELSVVRPSLPSSDKILFKLKGKKIVERIENTLTLQISPNPLAEREIAIEDARVIVTLPVEYMEKTPSLKPADDLSRVADFNQDNGSAVITFTASVLEKTLTYSIGPLITQKNQGASQVKIKYKGSGIGEGRKSFTLKNVSQVKVVEYYILNQEVPNKVEFFWKTDHAKTVHLHHQKVPNEGTKKLDLQNEQVCLVAKGEGLENLDEQSIQVRVPSRLLDSIVWKMTPERFEDTKLDRRADLEFNLEMPEPISLIGISALKFRLDGDIQFDKKTKLEVPDVLEVNKLEGASWEILPGEAKFSNLTLKVKSVWTQTQNAATARLSISRYVPEFRIGDETIFNIPKILKLRVSGFCALRQMPGQGGRYDQVRPFYKSENAVSATTTIILYGHRGNEIRKETKTIPNPSVPAQAICFDMNTVDWCYSFKLSVIVKGAEGQFEELDTQQSNLTKD